MSMSWLYVSRFWPTCTTLSYRGLWHCCRETSRLLSPPVRAILCWLMRLCKALISPILGMLIFESCVFVHADSEPDIMFVWNLNGLSMNRCCGGVSPSFHWICNHLWNPTEKKQDSISSTQENIHVKIEIWINKTLLLASITFHQNLHSPRIMSWRSRILKTLNLASASPTQRKYSKRVDDY